MAQKQAEYDIIAIQNIDDEDFVFVYNKSEGNYPNVIPAGEVKRFPRFLARHAIKHLIDKILNKRKERTNNQPARDALAEQIVIDEEVIQQPPKKSDVDELQENIENLNRESELDTVLKKHQDEKKPNEINTTPPVKDEPKAEEKFVGLPDEPKEEPKEKPKEEAPPMPTRAEIIDYAKTKSGMEIDESTLKKLNRMKVDELLTELGDPREDLSNG